MSRRIYVQFIEHKKDANPLIRVRGCSHITSAAGGGGGGMANADHC